MLHKKIGVSIMWDAFFIFQVGQNRTSFDSTRIASLYRIAMSGLFLVEVHIGEVLIYGVG